MTETSRFFVKVIGISDPKSSQTTAGVFYICETKDKGILSFYRAYKFKDVSIKDCILIDGRFEKEKLQGNIINNHISLFDVKLIKNVGSV